MNQNPQQPIKANDWTTDKPADSVYETDKPTPNDWSTDNPGTQSWTDPNNQQPSVEYEWDDNFYTWDDSRIFWV